MALIHSFEHSGNYLFKKRGIIPLFILLLTIPLLIIRNICFGNPISLSFFHFDIKPLIFVFSIIISLSGFLIRCYAIGTTPHGTSGRNTDKQLAKQLNTTGIYAIVRHPLYLGNYLMWAGALLFSCDFMLFLVVSLVYWLYYERIMFAEERFLEKEFGETYITWSLKVPAFIPAFKQFKKSTIPFLMKTALRREYTSVLSIVFIYVIIDYINSIIVSLSPHIKIYFYDGCFIRPSFYVLIIVSFITFILRTLKHHTHLLDRIEGRD